MNYFYVGLVTRSQAFLLERRLKAAGVECELAYMPREIMVDLCNMGVKFREDYFNAAIMVISRSGLPVNKVYREIIMPDRIKYVEVNLYQ